MGSYPVCVTGGAGFLGRRVVAELEARGYTKVSVPRSAEYDLREKPAVQAMLRETRPEVLIHLAAVVGGIGANRRWPGQFYYDNLIMGTHVIHEAYKAGVRKIIVVGTTCAYPKHCPVPFKEADLWNGYPEETNAPYGLAKRAMLAQCQAYRQQYGFNAAYLLPVNMFGPGDNFDLETSHVIPAMMRKCLDARDKGQEAIILWGDGSPTREFLYVDDAARGIVDAMECYDGPAPVNLGTGCEVSMKDLAEKIVAATGFAGRIVWDTAKPNGQPRRCLSTKRAEEMLSWRAKIDLDDGLRQTLDWYTRERERCR